MVNFFVHLSPVAQALIATTFTWFVTALGAAMVFFFKEVNRKFVNGMLGFAAGVMIAASYWSLLAPAIAMTEETSKTPGWFPAAMGFLAGGLFLRLIDFFLPHLHLGLPIGEAEGVHTKWKRSILLVLAITLHNIIHHWLSRYALATPVPSQSIPNLHRNHVQEKTGVPLGP